jgi:queuosine precursor transporter
MRREIEGSIFLVLFGLTIPVANWLASNFGVFCTPNGPCLIWVAPGLMTTSGVLMIGIGPARDDPTRAGPPLWTEGRL